MRKNSRYIELPMQLQCMQETNVFVVVLAKQPCRLFYRRENLSLKRGVDLQSESCQAHIAMP